MGLKVWLPLNGDLHNQGTSPFLNANIQSGVVIDNNGKIGKCYTNSGTTAPISTACTISTSQFSACAWVKINSKRSGWQRAFGMNASDSYFGLACEHTNGTTLGFHFYKTINGTNTSVFDTYPATLQLNTWVHYAMAYDGQKYYIYQNGVLLASNTASQQNIQCNMSNLWLFGGHASGYSFCSLNDVRIYDHCLSQAEVKEISQGLVLHYKLSDIVFPNYLVNSNFQNGTSNWYGVNGSTITTTTINNIKVGTGTKGTSNNIIGQTATYEYTANTTIDITVSARVYVEETGTFGVGNWITTTQASGWQGMSGTRTYNNNQLIAGWHTITSTLKNATNQYSGKIVTAFSFTGATFYITNVKLEINSVATAWCMSSSENITNLNTVSDSSGYNHNGICSSTIAVAGDTAKYNNSVVFNGTTDVITITNQGLNIILNSTCTIAFWVKHISENGGRSIYFSSYNGSPFWSLEKSANGAFRYDWNGSPDQYSANNVIIDNTWQHLCLVRESTTVAHFYLNGVLNKTFTTATTDLTNLVDTWRIGKDVRNNDGTPFHGYMSDFRIYCTALSNDDIKSIYESSGNIDDKKNLNIYETIETNSNLLAGKLWSTDYSIHNPITAPFNNINSNGEYYFSTNGTSTGSEYITINPNGHTYEYDFTISVNTGNQFYIGFERYDENKTARSNNACVYVYSTKPTTDVVRQRFIGTINLSTDGTNPCKYIALRILNGWSGTTSGVTGIATIHSLSLREIGTKYQQKITKTGQAIEEEIIEVDNARIQKNGIIEVNNLIEF